MVRARLGRLAANVLMVAMLLIAAATGADAQGAADVDALNKQAGQLYTQSKYKEAATVAEQALALAERVLGPEHPDTLSTVNNLAFFYQAQGRYGEAEPLFKRALDANERLLGQEHFETLTSVANLAAIYDNQGHRAQPSRFISARWRPASAYWERITPDTLTSIDDGTPREAHPSYWAPFVVVGEGGAAN
ncbi:MAG: tetratricopeptide repeat protein [Rhodomicrobium sp.]